MKLGQSVLDTSEARGARAVVSISIHHDRMLGDEGRNFVRECYENFALKISNLTKEALRLGLNDDLENREELKQRRDSWTIWFRELYKCMKEIDEGRPFNPVQALTAIAWLEAELFGFTETLNETKRLAESG